MIQPTFVILLLKILENFFLLFHIYVILLNFKLTILSYCMPMNSKSWFNTPHQPTKNKYKFDMY